MRKKRRRRGATRRGLVGVLFKGTQRLPAHVSEEPEWYLDGAEVKLTRVFTIVLILHLVAVGGILAFKMIEKASMPSLVTNADTEAATQAEKVTTKETKSSGKAAKSKQPVKEALKIERRNPVVVSDPSREGLSVYRVSNGETLVGVARDLGVSVAELRRLNDLHTGDKLYAGKWLSVPSKKQASVGNGSSPPDSAKVLKAKPISGFVAEEAQAHKSKNTAKAVVARPVVRNDKEKPVTKKKAGGSASVKDSTYTVQSGDTLYGIARKTGVKYSALLSLNKLEKPELLQVGQVLKIAGN